MAPYPNYRIAVEIVILHEDRILLTERAGMPGAWGVPAGKAKYDETPLQALLREAKEETNLDVELIRELDVRAAQFPLAGETAYRVLFTYLVKPSLDDVRQLELNDEHSAYAWVSQADLLSGTYRFEHENAAKLLAAALQKREM